MKMKIFLIIGAVAIVALLLGLLIGKSSRKSTSTKSIEGTTATNGSLPTSQVDTNKTSLSGKVYNLIILDESGSMGSVWKAALDGANETIQTIKSTQTAHPEQKQYLTFASFSDKGGEKFRVLVDNKSIEEVKDLTAKDYSPNGNTPLWDAMGFSLTRLEKSVTDQDLVLVTIITDGYENASREYDGKKIKTLVERLSAKDWAFAYIGANQDAIEVAGQMGIKNALNFEADEDGTKAMWRKEKRSRERYYMRGRIGTEKVRLKDDYFEED